ncbi:hypothetical protein PGT21_030721 [Puccinia graminis f. sp. tritici]|uniref:Uncharacterized protein n=1 Tax=Puccinia graminis f. sp. tritici TaxID=56615 RepID=A0A5B0QXS9_PUCGR|nr:hypothetical protein PGT21_030721 [Puccinia graminis f. sp. tritici]
MTVLIRIAEAEGTLLNDRSEQHQSAIEEALTSQISVRLLADRLPIVISDDQTCSSRAINTMSVASQTTPVKTYSQAVSGSEGTRSEPASKIVKKVSRKPKKQFNSPEIVPSEWDRDSDSSAKRNETRPSASSVIRPAKAEVKTNEIASSAKADKIKVKKNQPDSSPHEEANKKKTTRSNDPLPNVDPFKSKEKVSKLIDKDSISHLTFKKVDREALAVDKTANTVTSSNSSDQAPRADVASGRVDPLSEAAKTLLNGPKTFNEPINRSTQKSLDNYFVPQGRTVQSVSSRSSDHPGSSTTSDSVLPSDGSDLDIITGATAQLWSKPKTLPAPLEEDILLKFCPAFHPLLQGVKLNQEYFRRAVKTKDEDLKVVALRSASELQTDLLRSITQEEFQKIFNWNPKSEFNEYLHTQKGRNFLKERGAEVTPTPPPEVQMRPPEVEPSQIQPQEHLTENQSQPQMYYPSNSYHYPCPPMSQPTQHWPYQSYDLNYSTYQQGYYPPHQQAPQAEPSAAPQSTKKRENGQAPKNNRNRPRNRKEKGPSWVPPPNSNRVPPDSNSMSARERRRRAHQLSIHQEMIRLSRTTQAQYQALESMRNQNAGGENRRQPREDAQTPRN